MDIRERLDEARRKSVINDYVIAYLDAQLYEREIEAQKVWRDGFERFGHDFAEQVKGC